MSFVPMGRYSGNGVRCSVAPVAERNGGGWYCSTCDTQFGERSSPPCNQEALPNEKYDKSELTTVVNPPRIFR